VNINIGRDTVTFQYEAHRIVFVVRTGAVWRLEPDENGEYTLDAAKVSGPDHELVASAADYVRLMANALSSI